MKEQPKHCAHCDSPSTVFNATKPGDTGQVWYACCSSCQIQTSRCYSRKEAISAWNKRPDIKTNPKTETEHKTLSRQFKLITQIPKPKELGIGVLYVDQKGEARFFSGQGEIDAKILATMTRTRMEFTAANGINLSGMEQNGHDKHLAPKYRYQEWWLVYVNEGASHE